MPVLCSIRPGQLLALGLALAILAAGCGPHAAERQTVQKPSAPELPVLRAVVLRVEPSLWPSIVKTQGSLSADEVTVVGAKVAGRVNQVNVDLGDTTTENAPLATLDQEEFKLQIVLAEAQLTQSRAALGMSPTASVESLDPLNAPPVREARAIWDEVRARIERLRTLRARNAVTQDELDQALAQEGVAAARYTAAINSVQEKIALIRVRAAELSLAQQRLEETVVLAPFTGLVQQRHAAPGTFLQVGDPVVTLVRTSTLRFRGTVPERHAYRLALGQTVVLRVESLSEPIAVKISRLTPSVDLASRSLVFEALVPNENGPLRAGMFAEAEVDVDPAAETLAVPRSAIVEFAGVERVWKVVDGVAQEQAVKTARREDGRIEIAEGLATGDLILVDGGQGQVARIEPISDDQTSLHAAADPSAESPSAASAEPLSNTAE
jgi:RND family efflux transporter MFP subunit